jgi:hypothetical protein
MIRVLGDAVGCWSVHHLGGKDVCGLNLDRKFQICQFLCKKKEVVMEKM